jgi:hypothetical protein
MMSQDDWPASKKSGSGLTWLSWSYGAEHLPPDFHRDKRQFERFMAWLLTHPYRSQGDRLYNRDGLILMCLGIGLVLRDINAAQFEYGEEGVVVDPSVQHVQDSALRWGDGQALVRECRELRFDILRCFGDEPEKEESPPPPPKAGEGSKVRGSRGRGKTAVDE